jgi:nucleotide-binding universal stress UspA family protein
VFQQSLIPASERTVTYRSLLVHLDTDPACTARTRVAVALARQLDAHIVGVAPTGLVDLPPTFGGAAALAEYASFAWEALREQAELAAHAFREHCHAAGLKSFEAVVDQADRAPSLVRHAHCSDLTLLTQADPALPGHRGAQAAVEEVVLYSARPTLVLPYAGHVETLTGNVLVAWDDSRESARAVSDALPLLRLARDVQVVAWNEGSSAGGDLRPRLDALHGWLLWQGVSADVRVETTGIAVAEAMLSRAADMSADLIVMGAYGHARWTERVLGGATRGLLGSMTVPVLMSH